MTENNRLRFINHASFAIEQPNEILLIDPWYQGTAFDNGWALLDGTTSDSEIINWLKISRKRIYIWYSHEHSDHFSMSFLKSIVSENLDLVIIFQKTLDRRVARFLSRLGLAVIEAKEGHPVRVGAGLDITTWPHESGDSFCLIRSKDFSILNLNDCVVESEEHARKIRTTIASLTTNVDLLFTQFGYANWVGNESDIDQRVDLASRKLDRLLSQFKGIDPSHIIAFATFSFFCHSDNFFLNDAQNRPSDVISAPQLASIRERIFFLKPHDEISLESAESIESQLREMSESAIRHWEYCLDGIAPRTFAERSIAVVDLTKEFRQYRRKISLGAAGLPQLLQFAKIIEPIRIFVDDLGITLHLSYFGAPTIGHPQEGWDIAMRSEVLSFVFRNDFGFNTVTVNGRFRLHKDAELIDIVRFFWMQEFVKNGYGVSNPITTIKWLSSKFFRRAFGRMAGSRVRI